MQSALPLHFYATGPEQLRIGGELVTEEDYADLCHASLCVLLRRDASLNRRLFLWLKGGQHVEVGGTGQPVSLANSILSANEREALRVSPNWQDFQITILIPFSECTVAERYFFTNVNILF